MVPIDRPLIPLRQYAVGEIPVPQINFPPFLAQFLPKAAVMIVNICVANAQRTYSRMFLLNMIAQNNFQNELFTRIVDMSIRRAAAFAMQKGEPNNLGNYLSNAAEDMAEIWLCRIAVTNQQLMETLSFQDRITATRSSEMLDQLIRDLNNLNLNVYAAGMAGYGMPMGNTMQTSQAPVFQNYSPMFSTGQVQSSPGDSMIGSQWGSQGNVVPMTPNFGPTEHRVLSSPPIGSAIHPPQEFLMGSAVPMNPTATIIPIPSASPPPAAQQPQPPVVEPVRPSIKATQIQTVNRATEMDIDLHAIPYFGSDVRVNLTGRHLDLKQDVLHLNKASRSVVETVPVILSTSARYDFGLDSSLVEASQMLVNQHGEEGGPVVYRYFMVNVNARACLAGAEPVIESLEKSSNLGDIASRITMAYSNLFKQPDHPTPTELSLLNTLAYMDARYTRLVNNFLKFNLQVDVKITSFAEDYREIEGVLRRMGNPIADAFLVWASQTHSVMKDMATTDKAAIHALVVSQTEQTGQTNPTYVSVPELESVTYLNMTWKELQYDSPSNNQGLRVDHRTTPVLYDIVTTLSLNKKDRNMYTARDWLVTADDRRYILAESATAAGTWSIFECPTL